MGEFVISYHQDVVNSDIPKLPKSDAIRIKIAIEKKLKVAPQSYGKHLRGTLHPLWKLRVGATELFIDWRIKRF